MYLLLIIWAYLHLGCPFGVNSEGVLANTTYGEVKGQKKISRNGRLFHSFTSIRYAKAPIGELRFQAPEEPDPWNFTQDATKESPVCIQRNYLFSSNPPTEGQEDCLFLNVYVPEVNVFRKDTLLPVMVFIHWGAFVAGRSTTGYLGPEYFMDKDVVLVTFNYRLGPFGFLSTIDDEAPGNYGLKDQVAALKWVQRNIGNFGGDKNNVTLFGQSAGGGSVHYHLLSSASNGLFHKAISQSGNAFAPWAIPLNTIQKEVALAQAKFVGCDNSSNKDLIACLRSVSAEEIMKTQDYFRPFYGNPLGIFSVVLETKSERNLEPFLTKTPLEYVLNGEIKNVPWLTGAIKYEGILKSASLIRPHKVREELNQNFEKLLSDLLLIFSLSAANPHSLYRNVTEFYMGGKEYIDLEDPRTIEGLTDLYTDRAFLYPLYQSLQLHSQKSNAPIYLYNFEYEGSNTYGNLFAGTTETIEYHWGTCHCDDLLYLFNSSDLFVGSRKRNDILMSNVLLTLWTNFAKYGNPNPPENSVGANLNWKPLNLSAIHKNEVNHHIELLNITGDFNTGPKLEISKGFYEERMKFWTNSDIFENSIGLK